MHSHLQVSWLTLWLAGQKMAGHLQVQLRWFRTFGLAQPMWRQTQRQVEESQTLPVGQNAGFLQMRHLQVAGLTVWPTGQMMLRGHSQRQVRGFQK